MRPISPRLSFPSRLGVACVLVAAAGMLGACDRHSAQEIPESYGHGSNHASREARYSNHQTDSHPDSRSYSDTQGTEGGGDHAKAEKPVESPSASQPGRFFPNGS